MRVVVAAVSSASQLSGVQRHAFNLAACLRMLPDISGVDLVLAPWQRHLAETYARGAGRRMRLHFPDLANTAVARNAWFYQRLPALARELGADLVHAAYPVPLRRNAFHCPVVVTLHDLYPYEAPKNFGFAKAWVNRRVLQQCLRNVDAIACVSNATATAVRKFAPQCVWRKASRIYNCVQLSRHEVQPPHVMGAPFLLCVAQHRHNKNISFALESFYYLLQREGMHPDLWLLVIGIPGPESRRIRRHITRLGLADRVALVDGLSDQALLWCYHHCAALVMPSLSEGFGLPAVEALMAGCRVVCSSIPALREVGGAHCRFVSVTNENGPTFAQAILEALEQPVPAPVSFPQFSPANIARQYLALYRGVIACSAGTRRAPLHTEIASAASERPTL